MKRTLAVMALFIALLALPSAALAGEDVGLLLADRAGRARVRRRPRRAR